MKACRNTHSRNATNGIVGDSQMPESGVCLHRNVGVGLESRLSELDRCAFGACNRLANGCEEVFLAEVVFRLPDAVHY